MKTKLLLLLLSCSLFSSGQVRDLMKLANGKLVFNQIIYDSNDDLYGYFYLYERDGDSNSKKMEYVLLDKNLNKANNGEFTIKYNKRILYSYDDCTLMDDKIILSKNYAYYKAIQFIDDPPTYIASTFQILSLKDQTVSKEYLYKDGEIVPAPDDLETLKSESKKIKTKDVIAAFSDKKSSGFCITQFNGSKNYLENKVAIFDKDCKLKWEYEYNPNGTLAKNTSMKFEHFKDSTLYISEVDWNYSTAVKYKIVAINFNTGQKKYEYVLEYPNCNYIHRIRFKEIDRKLYLVGDYSKYHNGLLFNFNNRLGFFRIILDENGKELEKKYLPWASFKPTIELNKHGRDKWKFVLNPRNYFIFDDGRISILNEKYDKGNNDLLTQIFSALLNIPSYELQRTSDFLILNFNKDFALSRVDTIHKELTAENFSDYLFSQRIKNDSAFVFYYKNSFKDKTTKKQSAILGINILTGNQVTNEKIPLFSEKKYLIDVLPAKEGYVMLREYNENQKDKYNQIRLERLNY